MPTPHKAWAGQTVICIGSGPSLTREDCELTRGHRVIAINNSWRLAPWCDVIYAGDYQWWKANARHIEIPAERFSHQSRATEFGCEFFIRGTGLNSGLAGIHLAEYFGAKRIVLLGYDCQPTGGRNHWHEDHATLNNPNEISYRIWLKQFRNVDPGLKRKIVNCSRETALTGFSRARLEDELSGSQVQREA